MSARLGVILGVALLLGAGLAQFASQHPDTLEWFLESRDVVPEIEPVPAPFPDYGGPSGSDDRVSRALAGVAGVLATFGLLTLFATWVRRHRLRSGGSDRAS